MNGRFSKVFILGAIAAGGVAVACGPSLTIYTPEGSFDTAHDFAKQAEIAQADLPTCLQPDGGPQKCDPLNHDLCAILNRAISVESAAIDAGYQPAKDAVSTLPATCSNK
jgi:hypothetical protein